MKVTAIAATQFLQFPDSLRSTQIAKDARIFGRETDIDLLHEFAGRACYKSWEKPNPATRANEDYLQHIIDVEHVSILEHGQVSFYVEDVSRSLLLELERHGRNSHLSFSVESQRYVNTGKHHPNPVFPPLFDELDRNDETEGAILRNMLAHSYERALVDYDVAYTMLRDKGIPVKQAREAARAFLPNATPVDFVVTADIRAWREVIEKRDAPGADKEIQRFALMVEQELIALAPASMQEVSEDAA